MSVAFVVCPIGSAKSPERKRSDKLLARVIVPVCKELGLEVIRADKMKRPGRITEQVTNQLESSSVVIGDLTGLNPNVMFELGVRSGLKRPFVLLSKAKQELPFDLRDLRVIFYTLNPPGIESAKTELNAHIEAAMATSQHPVATPLTDDDISLAATSIENYLTRIKKQKGYSRVGFEGVRKWVNGTYSDELLNQVIHKFPNRLRQLRLKGDKPGIGLTGD